MAKSNLPAPGTPLLDGAMPVPTRGTVPAFVPVPTNVDAQRLVSNTQRKLLDMPGTPAQLNGWAAVLVYTASGIDDKEIALALRLTPSQVRSIKQQPGYLELERNMIAAVKEQTAEAVQDILSQGEVKAANRVVQLVDTVDEKVALAAANSILDRRGHKAAEKIDIRAQMLNTFRIEVVDKRENAAPVIDMELDDGDRT